MLYRESLTFCLEIIFSTEFPFMKKLLIFTDTCSDQINGVTRCLENLCANIPEWIQLHVVSSDDFLSMPFLGYKEIRLSLTFPRQIYRKMKAFKPDFVHIMTEGPIGLMAAHVCQKRHIPYTTTFHTKFPEYLHMRNRLVKESYVHEYLRYIHDGAEKIFISNTGLEQYLERNHYEWCEIIPFGIDHSIFHPGKKSLFFDMPKPIFLFVGRVAIEKNIEAFLEMKTPGTKIVVGDGPMLESLQKNYPHVYFLGKKTAQELGDIYRSVDIFVFPSKTDTLGLVNLEAMASGLPIIAYDIENTRGVIHHGKTGILVPEWEKLESAIEAASLLHSEAGVTYTSEFTWKNYAGKFIAHQFPISKKLWI